MNIVSNLSVVTVPRGVRILVIGILTALVVGYLALALFAVVDTTRPGWIEVATGLLGIALPLLLVGLVAAYSQSGVKALSERTSRLLTYDIPSLATIMYEPSGRMRAPYKSRPSDVAAPQIRLATNRNAPIAMYVMTVDLQKMALAETRSIIEIAFRLELNARGVNVNLLFPASHFPGKSFDEAETHFPHTLRGGTRAGYSYSEDMIVRTFSSRPYHAIVMSKPLPEDFLINPIAKIDFAQDLFIMLRSFVHENHAIFLHEKVGDAA